MSGRYNLADLHPLTVRSIEAQGSGVDLEWRCGCHSESRRHSHFWLCGYHEGYQDGIDALGEAKP